MTPLDSVPDDEDPRITADEYRMLIEWIGNLQDRLDELHQRLDKMIRKEGQNDQIENQLG